VTEAYDEVENELDNERWLECLRPVAYEPAPHIVAKVFEATDPFAVAAPQQNDITLLILKRIT
jgi:serine phosphatase RsbU (regulator of sigma subunit)